MSENPGIETGALVRHDFTGIHAVIEKVMLGGGLIQLLTEYDATVELLRDTAARQDVRLCALFSNLPPGKYDRAGASAWLAFSYTCSYAQKVVEHAATLAKKHVGQPDAAGLVASELRDGQTRFELRERALDDVLARRDDIVKEFILSPGVLFQGSGTLVKDLWHVDVTQGRSAPSTRRLLETAQELRPLLEAATFTPEADATWRQRLGAQYKLFWANLEQHDLQLKGVKVLAVEALLDPLQVQKVVVGGRVIFADGGRTEANNAFIRRVVAQRVGFSGDRLEYDTANMAPSLAGDTHWQAKEADWRLGLGGNRRTYYTEVHPKITQYVLSLVAGLEKVTILDIAGGNGDLAERIIREIFTARIFDDIEVTYILVDYSPADVAVASRRFRTIMSRQNHVKAVALERDMLTYKYDAALARMDLNLPSRGADIIINSGGLLNNQIGDNKRTPELFNLMYSQLLAPGGYGVYSGLTPLLVNAETHRKHGLKILNLFDPEVDRQVHVVQRPR